MATIESPDGVELEIEIEHGVVTIRNRGDYATTFRAEFIPELRAVLLDLERVHWGAK